MAVHSKAVFISTMVFLDLETTGLPSACFRPEITELCMIAVNRFTFEENSEPPRVKNKLSVCIRPSHPSQAMASKISGLNSKNLFHQKDFNVGTINLIQSFLSHLDPPICFIAHNGMRFDFPLLRAELTRIKGTGFRLTNYEGGPVFCADTLHMFRKLRHRLKDLAASNDSGFISQPEHSESSTGRPIEPLCCSSPKESFHAEAPSSFRLGETYAYMFGCQIPDAHQAEGDCKAMLKLVHHLGFDAIDWLQSNCTDFNSVPLMYSPEPLDPSIDYEEFPYKRKSAMPRASVEETTQQLDDVRIE